MNLKACNEHTIEDMEGSWDGMWKADCNLRTNCVKMYEITSLKGVRKKVLGGNNSGNGEDCETTVKGFT